MWAKTLKLKKMKLRNKILAMAVVAVAGVNVYLANDIQVQKNSLSLLNLENIAEAGDDGGDVQTDGPYTCVPTGDGGAYIYKKNSDGSYQKGWTCEGRTGQCLLQVNGIDCTGYVGPCTPDE